MPSLQFSTIAQLRSTEVCRQLGPHQEKCLPSCVWLTLYISSQESWAGKGPLTLGGWDSNWKHPTRPTGLGLGRLSVGMKTRTKECYVLRTSFFHLILMEGPFLGPSRGPQFSTEQIGASVYHGCIWRGSREQRHTQWLWHVAACYHRLMVLTVCVALYPDSDSMIN